MIELQQELWKAAISDAAGLIAAYIVPEDYGLSLSPASSADEASQFFRQLRDRVEFGKAARVIDLLETWDYSPHYQLQHRVFYSQGAIRGKIHVPLYLATRARSATVGIPVIRAAKQDNTPENMFVSEVISRTRRILREWTSVGGAEAKAARDYLKRLNRVEAKAPWNALRSKSRPPLRQLASAVKARLIADVIPAEPLRSLLELAVPQNAAEGFNVGAGALAFLASRDLKFEDRLFELLCLGWLHFGISTHRGTEQIEVFPDRLKRADGEPLIRASGKGWTASAYYQSGKPVPTRHWSYQRIRPRTRPQASIGQSLRAIFDFVLEISDGSQKRAIILDAKNRLRDQSEVTYKLLGYKENVHNGAGPFYAAAFFPGFDRKLAITELARDDSRVYLIRVPLSSGRRAILHLLRKVLPS